MTQDPWHELRQRILSHPSLDETDRAEWLELLDAAQAHPHGLARELGDLTREFQANVRRFEASHPETTATVDKILHFLSRMGI